VPSRDTTRELIAAYDHHAPSLPAVAATVHDEIRANGPVVWSSNYDGFWVAADYDSVLEVAKDADLFSTENQMGAGPRKGTAMPSNPIESGMLECPAGRQLRIRRALAPWFSRSATEHRRPEILEDTRFCLDQIIEKGEGEVISDLAGPVSALLTMRMLGMPRDDWRNYSDIMHRSMSTPQDSPDRPEVDQGLAWMFQQFQTAALAARAHPGDDLVGILATMQLDGEPMPIDEVVGNMFLLVAAGVDTTANLVAHAFLHLTRDRAARDWLMDDRARLADACEEYVRYFSPVPGVARTVTQPCTLGGRELRADDRLWILWSAANRDPKVFDDPAELRLDRAPRKHLGFGWGTHRCIGANSARAMWDVIMNEVLDRIPDFVADESRAVRYTSIGIIDGWSEVPITFTPGRPLGRPEPASHAR
jgi:cytochrome P450